MQFLLTSNLRVDQMVLCANVVTNVMAAHFTHSVSDMTNHHIHYEPEGSAGLQQPFIFIHTTDNNSCGLQQCNEYCNLAYTGVQLINELANQVDEVIPKVVEAARAVKKAPNDATAKDRLETARKEWADKVQQLTAATDDIIDPEDFIAVSGTQDPFNTIPKALLLFLQRLTFTRT